MRFEHVLVVGAGQMGGGIAQVAAVSGRRVSLYDAASGAVERGLGYLLRTQQADGAWEDAFWNGTGFPRVFMLKYHLYAKYFPLWALGVYRRIVHG